MILLWGALTDTPLRMVHDQLCAQHARVLLLDHRSVLDTELDLSIDAGLHGRIRIAGEEWNLDEVTAAYVRPPDPRSEPAVRQAGEGSLVWQHALALDDALNGWLELTDALVVHRGSAMAANNCKPLQAMQIRSFGFETPDTLIATDADAVQAFWAEHGAVIYKSISGVRSIVARLTEAHMQRMDDLGWCPTQFQQYVPGVDYRVHVVGEEVFACRIECEADDYRYASRQGLPIAIESLHPPSGMRGTLSLACGQHGLDARGHRSAPHAGGPLVLLRGESVSGLQLLPECRRAAHRSGRGMFADAGHGTAPRWSRNGQCPVRDRRVSRFSI